MRLGDEVFQSVQSMRHEDYETRVPNPLELEINKVRVSNL
jgi:hypothetical protein